MGSDYRNSFTLEIHCVVIHNQTNAAKQVKPEVHHVPEAIMNSINLVLTSGRAVQSANIFAVLCPRWTMTIKMLHNREFAVIPFYKRTNVPNLLTFLVTSGC